jgi:putative hemolysin
MIKLSISLVACALLLSLSAFFSSSETALFSLSEHEIDTLKTSERRRRQFLKMLTKKPHELLSTILLSNTVVNVAFSFLITLLFLRLLPLLQMNDRVVMTLGAMLVTLFLLIFGEFTPKFYALRRSKVLSRRSIIPLYYLMMLLRPFIFLLGLINRLIVGFAKKRHVAELTFSEVKTLFELSEQQGILLGREKELLRSLFILRELNVSEIMVPRKRIFSLDGRTTLGKAREMLLAHPHSRIPVYMESEERIEGILYLKDLLIHRSIEDKPISTIVREPLFVPESMKLKDLFLEFRNTQIHFALVVNEFGGVEGIVTMHDILEEIVGDIKEEFQKAPIPRYQVVSRDELTADAELMIDDLPKKFKKDLPPGDYETIGGVVLATLGRFPEEDETFTVGNLRITVMSARGQKMEKLRIRLLSKGGKE